MRGLYSPVLGTGRSRAQHKAREGAHPVNTTPYDEPGQTRGRGGVSGSRRDAAQVELLVAEEEPLPRVELSTRLDLDLVAHQGAHEHPVRRAEIGDRPRVAAKFDTGVRLRDGARIARNRHELRRRVGGDPDAGTSSHTGRTLRRAITV